MSKTNSVPQSLTPGELAPYLQDLYDHVSRRLGRDASFVVRVALGESKSPVVERALERELLDILERVRRDRVSRTGA